MNNKIDLRIKAKNIRKNLEIKSISSIIVEKIRNNKHYKSAKNILLFYPLQEEIDLLELLNDDKNFYLPKISGENLLICPYCSGDQLECSKFKTQEPCTNPINIEKIDLIFVPALMVDKNNYRLGYGGGFYDRLLKVCNAFTIVPIAKELVIPTLPIEAHDKKTNLVITQ